jgi:endonuclease YncB( thermonuclease family)
LPALKRIGGGGGRRTRRKLVSPAQIAIAGMGCLLGVMVVGAVLWAAAYWHRSSATKMAVTGVEVQVVDGDTVRVRGQVYRLVGFDAPESGSQARCAAERLLAERATARLRQLVARGPLQFEPVACSCPAGTEGTRRCNYGRLCAMLSADGRDVGAIMIAEGLARRYVCSGTRCPPRQGWC